MHEPHQSSWTDIRAVLRLPMVLDVLLPSSVTSGGLTWKGGKSLTRKVGKRVLSDSEGQQGGLDSEGQKERKGGDGV